jgi:hypothetical protein
MNSETNNMNTTLDNTDTKIANIDTMILKTPPRQNDNNPFRTPVGAARAASDAVPPNAPKRKVNKNDHPSIFAADLFPKENVIPFPLMEDGM